jgi:hypothetical protein
MDNTRTPKKYLMGILLKKTCGKTMAEMGI